ncbi:LOW QUALITY PROTEIN: hypothetical protein MC885_009536 [Smutsia gigantea]|nr:LOW QUALITY PROTEIN: hypothetical protein MC885_009536 [Smutsia gigantea]
METPEAELRIPNGLGGVGGVPLAGPGRPWAQSSPHYFLTSFHQEEKPPLPTPDMPASAEPSFSETDKEVFSPVMAAAATFSNMAEEPGPARAATPTAPDSGQPGPGPSLGPTSTVSGTSEDLRPPRRRLPPGKQIPCSSPGCCLSFPSVRDLAQHLRTHCPPTQSLEGKLFRCSTLSCTETFPSMQELVAHGKLHYKPNRYFKCENCLLRFRTHRSLFKHLHVCAEHAQSPAPPPPPALYKEPPAPERPPESDPASASGLQFPLLEPFTTPAPAPTGPFLPYLNPAPFGLSPPRLRPFLAAAPGPPASSAAVWKKSQGAGGSPRRPQGGSDAPSGDHQGGMEGISGLRPAGPGLLATAVPASFAGGQKRHPRNTGFCLKTYWPLRLHLLRRFRVKLAPGHAAPSRIVWEHTRGRYSCMQCAFSTASRPAMTLHLEDHRPGASAAPAPVQPRRDAPAGRAAHGFGVGAGGDGAEAQTPPPLPFADPAPLAPTASSLLSDGECPVFSSL